MPGTKSALDLQFENNKRYGAIVKKICIDAGYRRFVLSCTLAGFAALTLLSGETQAGVAALTADAKAVGFSLSTFVDEIPNYSGPIGPAGLLSMNTPAGARIMISGYGTQAGNVKVFSDSDGQHWGDVAVAQSYGHNDPAGLAALGGSIYLTEQAARFSGTSVNGKLVELNTDGTLKQDILSLHNATGIVADTFTGHLFVSNGAQVYDVDPAARTYSTFANLAADGLALSADGKILYMAVSNMNRVYGISTETTKAVVFDSGLMAGGVDGIALGSKGLAGNLFVNTNGGSLIEINLATKAQTTIVSGGSRGDFVTVDGYNGTLLFTQADRVLRLTAPSGSGFVSSVPEASTCALMCTGLALVGFVARRRRQG
jgi:hypothetical protein